MSKGISTDQNVANIGACLRGEGVEFVFRYYSAAAWKRMEVPEAAALNQAGLKLAVVYEDGPTEGQARGYFTAARGRRHGQNAYEFASDVIHQPHGSAIYFAVDFDYTNTTDLQGVADYFTAVRETILQQSNSGGQLDYEVGVYGSGSVCSMVKEGKNLAKYSWLAESTGWDGYSDYKNKCDVLQSVATGPVCQLKDYEFCTANANFGAFSLTLAHLPIRLLASAELLDTVASVTSAPPLFPPSGLLSRDPLARLGPASLELSVSGSVVHNATGSSFADPADVATYERCKANGGSEEYCLRIGDNGIGYWGDDTKQGSGASCALSPEWMAATWGSVAAAHLQPVLITNPGNGKTVTALIKDTLPHYSQRIDMNPDTCAALALRPPVLAHVTWRSVSA